MADSADTRSTSPGEILRGARELYGWSLEDVAAELNLLPHLVEALEADDYSHTAGWTYAVGYLRNYARLAGVSIEQAIADRQELLPPKEDGPGTMTETATSRPQPVPIQYRWVVTAGVLLVVVGGLYAAFLNRASDVERLRVDLAEETRSQSESVSEGDTTTPVDESVAIEPKPELAVTLTPTDESETRQPESVSVSVPDTKAEQSSPEIGSIADTATAGVAASTDNGSESVAKTPTAAAQAAQPNQPEGQSAKSSKKDQAKEQVAKKENQEQREKNQKSQKKEADPAKVAATSASTGANAKKKAQKQSSSSTKVKTAQNAPTKTAEKENKQTSSQTRASSATSAQSQTRNPEVSSSSADTGATTRPVTADSRGITLKVKESTHVVVWDRDNVELLRRYVEGGKVVSLAGKPPFTLLVSYPEGTKVVYGGREFSIPVGKSGRNAKVRVGR
jgi:cytoskeleton protein RodZ